MSQILGMGLLKKLQLHLPPLVPARLVVPTTKASCWSSKLPWSEERGTEIEQLKTNTTTLTVFTEIQPFFKNGCSTRLRSSQKVDSDNFCQCSPCFYGGETFGCPYSSIFTDITLYHFSVKDRETLSSHRTLYPPPFLLWPSYTWHLHTMKTLPDNAIIFVFSHHTYLKSLKGRGTVWYIYPHIFHLCCSSLFLKFQVSL